MNQEDIKTDSVDDLFKSLEKYRQVVVFLKEDRILSNTRCASFLSERNEMEEKYLSVLLQQNFQDNYDMKRVLKELQKKLIEMQQREKDNDCRIESFRDRISDLISELIALSKKYYSTLVHTPSLEDKDVNIGDVNLVQENKIFLLENRLKLFEELQGLEKTRMDSLRKDYDLIQDQVTHYKTLYEEKLKEVEHLKIYAIISAQNVTEKSIVSSPDESLRSPEMSLISSTIHNDSGRGRKRAATATAATSTPTYRDKPSARKSFVEDNILSQITNNFFLNETPSKAESKYRDDEEKNDKKKKYIPAFFKKDKDKENHNNEGDEGYKTARSKSRSEKQYTLVRVQQPPPMKKLETPNSSDIDNRKPLTRSSTANTQDKPKKNPLVVTTSLRKDSSLQIDRLPLEKIKPLESPRLVTTPYISGKPKGLHEAQTDIQLIEELDKVLDNILTPKTSEL